MKDAELLTRDQLKNVLGGDDGGSGSCSSTAMCYKTIWQNGAWVTVPNGSVSCSGASCSHSDNGVSCDGSDVNC